MKKGMKRKYSIWVDEYERGNSQCICGGFESEDEAYNWASSQGYTGRIGFDIKYYYV